MPVLLRYLVCLIIMLSVGCFGGGADRPDMGDVEGVITLDGEPLPGVVILFKPEVGRQSRAKSDENGKYKAMYTIDEPGVKAGPNCNVTVEWDIDESGPAIPAEWGPAAGKKMDVKAGEVNEFNIDMVSKN